MNKEIYIKNKLNTFNQNHLIDYFDELNETEKEKLLDQLYSIDFNLISNLYINSFKDEKKYKNLTSLPIINNEELSNKEIKDYNDYGNNILINNKYAICLMAGGSGTRLGSNIPKGIYEFKYKNKTTTLFKIFFDKLYEINNKYKISIPVYIMTSESNYEDTLLYLEQNNYFNCLNIKIFTQDNLPLLDTKGNIILKNKYTIYEEPNGNGNVFKSLKINGYFDELKELNIEWIYFCGIDNIYNNIADNTFIGVTALNNYLVSSKSITINKYENSNYVFCLKDNFPAMLTNKELTKNIFNKKEKNKYIYRENNILMHLINIKELDKYCNLNLEYHRAYKKYCYLDKEEYIFKFEQFIFDAFKSSKTMLCFSVNKNDFYPIKTIDDINNLDR